MGVYYIFFNGTYVKIEFLFYVKIKPLFLGFQANRADIVVLDAGEVYSAVKQFELVFVAKEVYTDGNVCFTGPDMLPLPNWGLKM